jgi:hypothetical protein
MGESRIPNFSFDYNPKMEEKWGVLNRDGHCEVGTDQSPNLWRDDDDVVIVVVILDNVENTHFILNIFFLENCAINEITLKKVVQSDRSQITM